MRVTGWCNGGGVYGIRVSTADRNTHFDCQWESVTLRLGERRVYIGITPSFWRCCTELRSSEIRDWMLEKGLAPWLKGKPPVFDLIPDGDRCFRLEGLGDPIERRHP